MSGRHTGALSKVTTQAQKAAVLQSRGVLVGGGSSVTLTLSNVTINPYTDISRRECGPDQVGAVYFVFGVFQTGTDTKALIKVNFKNPPPRPTVAPSRTAAPSSGPAAPAALPHDLQPRPTR